MWHAQSAGYGPVLGNVDQHPRFESLISTPALLRAGFSKCRCHGWHAIAHSQTVEVTLIFVYQLRDKRRPPAVEETEFFRGTGNTVKSCIDEIQSPFAKGHIVTVDLPGFELLGRLKLSCRRFLFVRRCSATPIEQDSFLYRNCKPITIQCHSHRSLEINRSEAQTAIHATDENQLAGVVSGDRQASARLGQPLSELAAGPAAQRSLFRDDVAGQRVLAGGERIDTMMTGFWFSARCGGGFTLLVEVPGLVLSCAHA